jgi:hypothetical protein
VVILLSLDREDERRQINNVVRIVGFEGPSALVRRVIHMS